MLSAQFMPSARFLPWIMWGVTTLFFAYQFIMRLAPGLIMPELMQKFNVNATSYGLFAALYYFAYAGMQIPIALLLDRFGPRLVVSISVLACSLGTLLLVYTEHWELALLSRFLIGAGSAAGFLGSSKVLSSWFSEKLYTKMVGLTFTFGLLGAVYGGKPMGSLIAQFGWTAALTLVGLVGLGLSLLVVLLVKNPSVLNTKVSNPNVSNLDISNARVLNTNLSNAKVSTSNKSSDKNSSILNNLKTIVCNKHLLLIALANFLMVGALEGFADVWGVPYLSTTHGMLKENAAQVVSTLFVGMLFGGPILAYFADKLRSNYWVAATAGLGMGLIFLVLLSLNTHLEVSTLYVLLFLTGILCCYQVLVFAIGVSLVPKHLTSLTVAFLNCINMLGGSFFHNLIGYCMDFFWNGTMENGVRIYDGYAYTYALSSIAVTAVLGGVLIFLAGPKRKTILSENIKKNTQENSKEDIEKNIKENTRKNLLNNPVG